jgi:hypothetical protein
MVLLTSKEYRYPDSGELRKYYRCANIKGCDITYKADLNGVPFGIPGSIEARTARDDLHQIFDRLWTTKRWLRREAYYILQILTGLDEEQAHIACFDEAQCERVREKIEEFLELNPLRGCDNGISIPYNYRFVYVRRKCAEHGIEVHRVYLRGRQEFCVNCLSCRNRPVWQNFLIFIKEGFG